VNSKLANLAQSLYFIVLAVQNKENWGYFKVLALAFTIQVQTEINIPRNSSQ